MAVAFRAKLWNIGAEAQLYMGALVTVIFGTSALGLPGPQPLILIALAAMLGGAMMLLGPVILKTRFGVDEVVTTLLSQLHHAALHLASPGGAVEGPDGMGWPKSPRLDPDARLPRIVDGLRLHWGFALALICAAVVWVIETRTTLGYEIRAVGQNPRAARFAGIPVNLVLLKTALLVGRAGSPGRVFRSRGSQGVAYARSQPRLWIHGIIVAMLALLHPIGVVVSAIFVAGVFVGADSMSRAAGVPTYIADILLATALLFMVLAILLDPLPDRQGLMDILEILLSRQFLGGSRAHRFAPDLCDHGRVDLRTRRAC